MAPRSGAWAIAPRPALVPAGLSWRCVDLLESHVSRSAHAGLVQIGVHMSKRSVDRQHHEDVESDTEGFGSDLLGEIGGLVLQLVCYALIWVTLEFSSELVSNLLSLPEGDLWREFMPVLIPCAVWVVYRWRRSSQDARRKRQKAERRAKRDRSDRESGATAGGGAQWV